MHLHGLTGLKKALWETDLAIYTHVCDVSGQYESVALMLSHKMDFYFCASRDGFCKSSHILLYFAWADPKVQQFYNYIYHNVSRGSYRTSYIME